jgi:two-component system response regulator
MDDTDVLVVGIQGTSGSALMQLVRAACPGARLRFADGIAQAREFLLGLGAHCGRDTRTQPRLVLLEVREDGSPCQDFVDAVRHSDEAALVPVVALAQLCSAELLASCHEAGINSVVCRPRTTEGLVHALRLTCDFWLRTNEVIGI